MICLKQEKKKSINDIALLRLEQIAPFPYDRIREVLVAYPKAEINWCQEEHFNMGAWSFVQPRFNKILEESKRPLIKYFGRKPSSSSAVGKLKIHLKELDEFLNDVFK